MNQVGIRIRKLREARGLNQESLAQELGLKQSSYGRLEKNDERLTVPKLLIIAEVLKVPVAVLFGEKTGNNINENKGDNAQAQIGTIIQQDKEYIASLKDEIMFCRKIIEKLTQTDKQLPHQLDQLFDGH